MPARVYNAQLWGLISREQYRASTYRSAWFCAQNFKFFGVIPPDRQCGRRWQFDTSVYGAEHPTFFAYGSKTLTATTDNVLWLQLRYFMPNEEYTFSIKWQFYAKKCAVASAKIPFVGWALCGRPQAEHESVVPVLSLSPLKVTNLNDVRFILLLSKNI